MKHSRGAGFIQGFFTDVFDKFFKPVTLQQAGKAVAGQERPAVAN